MDKILSKQQIKVIMALNAVLIIMFVCVLAKFNINASDTAIIPPPPAHNLIRAARVSANEDILWETNLGGSGAEQLIGAFIQHNRIYIFGNTASDDLDFAGSKGGGFCAIVTRAGNTKSFTVYPFNITKVTPTLNGFAVAANQGSTAMLKIINSDGVVTGGATLSPNVKQIAQDIYIDGSSYYLVSSFFDSTLGKNTIFVNAYTSELSHKFQYAFNCAYDLQYINILPYKKSLMLCANVVSKRANYLAMIIFDRLNAPTFKYIESDDGYFCYNVMPFDAGYAAICSNNNIPEIITVTNDFKKDLTKNLHCDSDDACAMFFANNNYYSFVKPTSGESVLQKMNASLSTIKYIDEGSDFTLLQDNTQTAKAAYILGNANNKLKILGLSADGTILEKQFATANECGGKIIPLEDGLLVVANSSSVSPDVGGNFGETDIWIAKISLV